MEEYPISVEVILL